MIKVKSKFDQVYDYLVSDVLESLSIGQSLPTEVELAKRLSVNRMTVSKVMAVLSAEGILDRKQGRGSLLIRRPRAKSLQGILTLVPGLNMSLVERDPHFSLMSHAMTSASIARNWTNTFVPLHQDGTPLANFSPLRRLWDSQVYRGVVMTYSLRRLVEPLETCCRELQAPLVWVSAGESVRVTQSVGVDNREATAQLCQHLIQRGCKRIGLLSNDVLTGENEDRIRAYRQTLQKHNIEVREDWVYIAEGGDAHASGYQGIRYFVEHNIPIDGLFSPTGRFVHGVNEAFKEFSNHPICKIPVVSFDYPYDIACPNVIASAIQPIQRIAQAAVEQLAEDQIQGEDNTSHQLFKALIVTSLDEMTALLHNQTVGTCF